MLFLRLFGKSLLFAAFLAAAYDGARIIATPANGLVLASLASHLDSHLPGAREIFESFCRGHAPLYVWTALLQPMLALPLSLLLGTLGALVFLAGYRRPPPEILSDEA